MQNPTVQKRHVQAFQKETDQEEKLNYSKDEDGELVFLCECKPGQIGNVCLQIQGKEYRMNQ